MRHSSQQKKTTLIGVGLFLLLPGLMAMRAVSAQQATTFSCTAAGGYVDVKNCGDSVTASLGRWDTPYPFGNGGPPLPGVEPLGVESLSVSFQTPETPPNTTPVTSYLRFDYWYQTYDSAEFDYINISLTGPDGTISYVPNTGAPGAWGKYYRARNVSYKIPIPPSWGGELLTLDVSVAEDGYGDQFQGNIVGVSMDTCPIPPLTDVIDQEALDFENGKYPGNIDLDASDNHPTVISASKCIPESCTLITLAGNLEDLNNGRVPRGGTNCAVASAYRSPAYQAHLAEVADKYRTLKTMRNTRPQTFAQCAAVWQRVSKEFSDHHLAESSSAKVPADPTSSKHTFSPGEALDFTIGKTPRARQVLEQAAEQCGMVAPGKLKNTDPGHVEVKK